MWVVNLELTPGIVLHHASGSSPLVEYHQPWRVWVDRFSGVCHQLAKSDCRLSFRIFLDI